MDIEWPLTDIEYSTVENCFQSKASVPVCALSRQKKSPSRQLGDLSHLMPGNDLLSHGGFHTIIGAEQFHF